MIKTHRLTRLLLAALLLPALPAWATNLQEAFDAAQRQDPTVQAARLQVDIDNQQRKAARSRLRPSLGAELGTTNGQLHTNLFSRHYYDNRLAGINLSIPVYSPQDAARLQQAQVAELLAQSRLAQALQSLAAQRSPLTPVQAKICIEACKQCADACKEHIDHHVECKDCYESCLKCVEACEKIAVK